VKLDFSAPTLGPTDADQAAIGERSQVAIVSEVTILSPLVATQAD
jgi:hypothetical protein